MESTIAVWPSATEQWKWGDRVAVIFPNPVRQEMVLKMNSTYTGKAAVHIYTMQGKLVYFENFEKRTPILTKYLYLNGLPAGIYNVQVSEGHKPLLTKRISKLD